MNQKQIELAYALSKWAHYGQKYGNHDYFEYHILGVANQFDKGSEEYIVALLHDVIEDSEINAMTIYNLFGERIGYALIDITRDPEDTYEYYISCFRKGTLAHKVKIADLKFHLSQPIVKNEKRYRDALAVLESTVDPAGQSCE